MAERQQDTRADGERSGRGEPIRRREEVGAAPPRGGSEAAGAYGNAVHDGDRVRGPAGTGQGGGGGIAEVELDQLAGEAADRPGVAAADTPPKDSGRAKSDRPVDAGLTGRRDGHKTEEELRRSGEQP